ncbi:MAG: flagellar protein FlgN [Nitrospira sp.]|nr:flagellar protein FlgN [Nitrospira sp.]
MNTQPHMLGGVDLLRLISEQEAVCQTLLQTMYEERQAIRSLDLERLHAVNDKRLMLLESLQRLSQEANETARTLLLQHGDAPASFRAMGELLGQEAAAVFQTRYDSLSRMAQRVCEELKRNGSLVEAVRLVLDQTLSAARLASSGPESYGSDGRRISMWAHGILSQQG